MQIPRAGDLKGSNVISAIIPVHDQRKRTTANEFQTRNRPSDSSATVAERMNLCECVVNPGRLEPPPGDHAACALHVVHQADPSHTPRAPEDNTREPSRFASDCWAVICRHLLANPRRRNFQIGPGRSASSHVASRLHAAPGCNRQSDPDCP